MPDTLAADKVDNPCWHKFVKMCPHLGSFNLFLISGSKHISQSVTSPSSSTKSGRQQLSSKQLRMCCGSSIKHSRIVLYLEPLANLPSSNKTSECTQSVAPTSVFTVSPVVVFHSLIVLSSEPLASVPSCSTTNSVTG